MKQDPESAPETTAEQPVIDPANKAEESIIVQAVIASPTETKEENLLAQEAKYWQNKRKSLLNSLLGLLLILLATTVVMALIKALFEQHTFSAAMAWLFAIPATAAVSGDFTTLLAPLVAISVAIERLLETIFDYLERGMYNIGDLLKSGENAMGLIGIVYRKAYDDMTAAMKNMRDNPHDKAAIAAFDEAKKAFATAEQNVTSYLDGAQYKTWKRYLTLGGSFVLGLVVAVFADLGMLRMIGVPAPRIFDMILTGMVIGSGSGPMHSLIGILQGGKDAIDSLRQSVQNNAIKKAAEDIKKEIAKTQS